MSKVKTKAETRISSDFIDEISQRLAEGKQVRRTLPDHGRLHIDRNIPFLVVYRHSKDKSDAGTEQLITGEASYLMASSSSKHKTGNATLVRTVVENLSRAPGSFLIIEIWAGESPIQIIDQENERTAPSFRILTPPDRIPASSVEALKKALTRIVVSRNKGLVSTDYSKRPWPAHLPPLLTAKEILRYNCFLIGLEVSPIYRDPVSNEVFPLVLKRIHRGISRAIKMGAYEFLHKNTTLRPASFKSLGRRAVVQAVWEVDQKLAEISNELDFLLMVTPINIEQAWNNFKSGRFSKEPVFYYRPIPVDPSMLKRKLYQIPFDKIEDPTLSAIFHKKMVELEMKFSMLRDRNTRKFFYGSMQLFGDIDKDLLELSGKILDQIPPKSREFSGSKKVNAATFAARAREEINLFRQVLPDLKTRVHIRDDINGLLVSHGNLLIGKRLQVHESRVEALIQHEVGTHVLTYLNGKEQPFKQLYGGLSGSDELQEGLAVMAEYLVGGLSPPRFRLLAGRVLTAQMLIQGATFIEAFRELHKNRGFAQRTAYTIVSRIYRGGGYTKDAIYLRGFVDLVHHLREGGELAPLMVGKISMEDIPVIQELQLRKVLKPPALMPHYLELEQTLATLEEIRKGKLIFKLI